MADKPVDDTPALPDKPKTLEESIRELKERKETLKKSSELSFLEDISEFLKSRQIAVKDLAFKTEGSGYSKKVYKQADGEPDFSCLKDHVDPGDCHFVKICEINHDEKKPPREVFENVLGALTNEDFNFVYIISGSQTGVEIFFGIVKNYINYKDYKDGKRNIFRASEYGEHVLEASLTGNFPGSRFTDKSGAGESKGYNALSEKEMNEKIFNPIRNSEAVSILTGIPSMNEKNGLERSDFQGIDRLINTMMGSTWQFIVVCEPVKYEETQNLKKELYSIFDHLHLMSKVSIQMSTNSGNSIGKTEGQSESRTKGKSTGGSTGESDGDSKSQHSKQKNWGDNTGETNSDNRSASLTLSSGESQSITFEKIDKRINEVLSYINDEYLDRIKLGETKGFFKTTAYALTKENCINERLCRSIMSIFQGDRISFRPLTANRLTGSREGASDAGAASENGGNDEKRWRDIRNKMLLHFQTLSVPGGNIDERAATLYSAPIAGDGRFEAATYMTAKEVSLIAGIPMKEVPGLALIEGTEFGLNIDRAAAAGHRGVKLGSVIYRGRKLDGQEIFIDKAILNKHVFITGVTGSGKTTATQRILMESKLPFFVIEPAKTEYRELLDRFRDQKDEFVIFTLGDETLAPFRFNPFELFPGELITSHIDMLRAAFMGAFTMEAAMPQLIEETINNIYKNSGWNINNNKNEFCDYSKGEDPWNTDGIYWPKFSDLIVELKKVVKNHGFGDRLEAEYIGSLVSRLNNFTVGSKGRIFNCRNSVDFSKLLDKKVIFELEEIRTPEDKALIMGLVLSRLIAAVKARYKKEEKEIFELSVKQSHDSGTDKAEHKKESKAAVSHLIIIEEAHRLLSKYIPGDCIAKKDAVTMFADMLSEVRKYREGIVIIDQIPNKLESDVLKNTNTKIVHRLFAQDDKEAVGATMAMDDGQKKFLSSLAIGEAIIFTENWNKPVHAKIDTALEGGLKNQQSGASDDDSCDEPKLEPLETLIKQAGLRQLEENKSLLFPAFERAVSAMEERFDISGADLKKYDEEIGELISKFKAVLDKVLVKIRKDLSVPIDLKELDECDRKEIKNFALYFMRFISSFNNEAVDFSVNKKLIDIIWRMVSYGIIYERGPWIFSSSELIKSMYKDDVCKNDAEALLNGGLNIIGILDLAAGAVRELMEALCAAGLKDDKEESYKKLIRFLGPDNDKKRRIALKM